MTNNNISKEEFSGAGILKLCAVRKKFIFSFVTIFSAVVIAISFFLPQEFEAEATILPPDEGEGGGGLSSFLSSLSGGISLGGLGQSSKGYLYSDLLTSREVAKYIVDNTNIEDFPQYQADEIEDLYDRIRKMLEVDINKSGLIIVQAASGTGWLPNDEDIKAASNLVAEVINTAVDGLNDITRKKSNSKASKKRKFVSKILDKTRADLDSVDAEMEKFSTENNVFEIEQQTEALLGQAVNIGKELFLAEAELNFIMQDMNADAPKARAYSSRVESLRNQYNKAQQGGMTESDALSIPVEKVPALIRQYTNLVRDQKILVQVILYLETQKYQHAIQEESDIPTVQVLDAAVPPVRRSSPSRKMMLILSILLSTAISVVWISIDAFKKGRIYFRKEGSE